MSKNFENSLKNIQELIEYRLKEILDQACKDIPNRLADAMNYGTLKGGKRLRPFLHISAVSLLEGDPKVALDIACAIELVHCYSLIHDDLPGMDNSFLRRGKPSVHAKFDHSTAILAGTALYTLAFEVLTRIDIAAEKRLQLIQNLAQASAGSGMMGGQQLDMEATKTNKDLTLKHITNLQLLKTGALIEFSLNSATISCSSTKDDQEILKLYGKNYGLAFQITDDLLDIKSTTDVIGKPAQADINKATFISHLGVEKAEEKAFSLIEDSCLALSKYGNKADALTKAAHALLDRFS